MREWYAEPDSVADIDVEAFAYDAPFDREDEVSESGLVYEDSAVEESLAYDEPYDAYDEDDWGFEDDDDDDDELLEALEEALDEVEAEERIEAIREKAAPAHDVAEMSPGPEKVYRDAICHFMGQRPRPEAPRYSQIRTRALPSTGGLDDLLQDSLRRARNNMERWRIEGWASDLPQAHLGSRRSELREPTTY